MIYLARHGETTWNAEGRYQGRLESDLSALGERQARALAGFFRERRDRGEPVPMRVISSPLRRCVATSSYAAAALGAGLETDPRIIEIAHGTWEGRLRDEIASNDPLLYNAWRNEPAAAAFENGETLLDVDRRWRAFAADLPLDGSDLLVCTHDAVVRVALLALASRPLDAFWSVRAENGAFALIANERSGLRVEAECINEHLHGDRADPQTQAL